MTKKTPEALPPSEDSFNRFLKKALASVAVYAVILVFCFTQFALAVKGSSALANPNLAAGAVRGPVITETGDQSEKTPLVWIGACLGVTVIYVTGSVIALHTLKKKGIFSQEN